MSGRRPSSGTGHLAPPVQAEIRHQASYRAAANRNLLAKESLPYRSDPIAQTIGRSGTRDLFTPYHVTLNPSRSATRNSLSDLRT